MELTWLTLSPSGGDPLTDLTDAVSPWDTRTQSTTKNNLPSMLRDDSYTKILPWEKAHHKFTAGEKLLFFLLLLMWIVGEYYPRVKERKQWKWPPKLKVG